MYLAHFFFFLNLFCFVEILDEGDSDSNTDQEAGSSEDEEEEEDEEGEEEEEGKVWLFQVCCKHSGVKWILKYHSKTALNSLRRDCEKCHWSLVGEDFSIPYRTEDCPLQQESHPKSFKQGNSFLLTT